MKIAFISPKSLLDCNSGAALELKTVFEQMTNNGHQVQSFSFNCYDMGDDYNNDSRIEKNLNRKSNIGRLFHYDLNNIRHYIMIGSSKNTEKLNNIDLNKFIESAKAFLNEYRPDCVCFFGSQELMPILKFANFLDSKIIMYAGTAAYESDRKALFEISDNIICPSKYIAKYYRNKFSVHTSVINTTLPFRREKFKINRPDKNKFVTLINPSPDKGGHIFLNIANTMRNDNLNFLAVESRGTRKFWDDRNITTGDIENLWWAPWQSDITQVFEKTSILLMPSLVDEAAGKVISEAMSFGIPCIGYNTGGIPEQIGSGGIIIEMNKSLVADKETGLYNTQVDHEDIDVWRHHILRLLHSEQEYMHLSRQAYRESARFDKELIAQKWIDLIEDTIRQEPPRVAV